MGGGDIQVWWHVPVSNPSLGYIGTRTKVGTFSIGQTVPFHTLPCVPAALFIISIHPFRKPKPAPPRPAFIQGSLHTRNPLLLYSLSCGVINKPVTRVQLTHTEPLGKEGESQDLGASQPLLQRCSSLHPQNRACAAAHCCATRTCSSFNPTCPLNVGTPSAQVGTLRVRAGDTVSLSRGARRPLVYMHINK